MARNDMMILPNTLPFLMGRSQGFPWGRDRAHCAPEWPIRNCVFGDSQPIHGGAFSCYGRRYALRSYSSFSHSWRQAVSPAGPILPYRRTRPQLPIHHSPHCQRTPRRLHIRPSRHCQRTPRRLHIRPSRHCQRIPRRLHTHRSRHCRRIRLQLPIHRSRRCRRTRPRPHIRLCQHTRPFQRQRIRPPQAQHHSPQMLRLPPLLEHLAARVSTYGTAR